MWSRDPSPRHVLFVAALIPATLVSCAAHSSAEFRTSSPEAETEPNDPVGGIEQTAPTDHGSAEAGVLTLTVTPSVRHARKAVAAYFKAITAESLAELGRLFEGNSTDVRTHRNAARAINEWRLRFARLDYSELSTDVLYHEREVQVYRYDEWQALKTERQFQLQPTQDQLLVVVPVRLQKKGKVRYFGTDMELLMEPTARGMRIVEFQEDFRLPY